MHPTALLTSFAIGALESQFLRCLLQCSNIGFIDQYRRKIIAMICEHKLAKKIERLKK